MNNILIVFHSKHGATRKFAKMIAAELDAVELYDFCSKTQPDLDKFQVVVLGSSTYMGKLHKKLTKFSKNNLEKLLSKKIFLFSIGGLADKYQEVMRNSLPGKLIDAAELCEYGGYAFYFEKMNFIEKIVSRVTGVKESEEKFKKETAVKIAKAIKNE